MAIRLVSPDSDAGPKQGITDPDFDPLFEGSFSEVRDEQPPPQDGEEDA